jgi:YD repeat-containing protein
MGKGDSKAALCPTLTQGGRSSARRTLPRFGGVLVGFVILLASLPLSAAAAECTATWSGPAEGLWGTAGNWSTGKVPTSTDVACIGSGKTAQVTSSGSKVAVVQGEGTLKLEGGGLELTRSPSEGTSVMSSVIVSFGNLLGIGELDITKTLTWSGSGSMLGSGKTALAEGATGSISGGGTLETRTFVNEGTLTIGSSYLMMAATAKLENKGAFVVNSEPVEGAIRKPSKTTPVIVNQGLIKKSAGAGESIIRVTTENFGTINAATGKFLFEAGETLKLEPSSILEGFIRIQGPPAVGKNFTARGTLEIGSPTSLEIPGGYVANIATLRLAGFLKGAGNIEVTNFLYVGPSWGMRGTGSTTLTPEASGELYSLTMEERTLVNEGTITSGPKILALGYGAKIENRGTFSVNSEVTGADIYQLGGAAPSIINTGTFQKSSGAGTTEVDVPFTNYGVVRELSGKLLFTKATNVPFANRFGKRSECADPVDCATGDFGELQTDMSIGGKGVGLNLVRSYSARSAAIAASPGAFGYGWFNSYGDRLTSEESGKKITLTRGDGTAVPFTGGPGTFSSPAWSQDTLTGTAESGYTLLRADQTKYKFSGAGKLESITDRNGNKTSISYDGSGRLQEVTDPAGRKLTLAYNAEGLVKSVEDPMGRTVSYAYESKNLKSVTMPGAVSPRWQFKYDGSHRITEMIDGRSGKTTNSYDGSSRVTSQTDPAGRTIKFEYSTFHTKVTNQTTGAVTDEWFTSNGQHFL